MAKVGRLLLLALSLNLLSGAVTPLHAQEKLTALSLERGKIGKPCTPLSPYLFVSDQNCELKKLSQKEQAIIAQVNKEETPNTVLSHSLEPTFYITPFETPTPSVSPAETLQTTPIPQISQAAQDYISVEGPNLNSELIFNLINSHRSSIGKAPFQKDDALCSLAQIRSTELSAEFANGSLHSGLYNRNLPYWITENAKWGSNEAGTVQWWLNSGVHRRAIEGDYTYSCGACVGNSCVQLFTSYTPKVTNPASKSQTSPQESIASL